MLESGNDAAVAIAIHVSGSVDKFVDKMNEKAQALGCTNTHFANPNGLDADGHYSSARDLAKIMANAMENELFAQIVSTKSISFSGRSFQNHNKLLWSCDGVIGGKTGYTKSAGRTLVSCAERDGMRLICVTLNDSDDWNDHINLYDEMFSEWEIFDVSNGVSLPTVPVVSGKTDTVSLRTSEITRLLVQKGETPEISFELPSFVYATVQKGDTAGYMKVAYGGKEYSAQLIFNETVERDPALKLSLLEKIKRGFAGLVYKSFSGLGYEPETNKD
jgi:D-alanyl-D-alanine carboxypeptidase